MAVSVDLPKELREFVESEIEKGRYNSKSELLRDALRLKMANEELEASVIRGRTVERLEIAMEDVRDGRTYSPDEARERVLE